MKKMLIAGVLLLFSTSAMSTQYQCNVYRSNGVYGSGTITEVDGSVSYHAFDTNENYTSGKLLGVRTKDIMLKGKEIDNVAACTNISTTVTVDNFDNKTFTFKNNASGNTLTFTNCDEVQEPEVSDDVPCELPLPEAAVCPSAASKSIDDRLVDASKKPQHKKAHKPKSPFDPERKKPKLKQPNPDNMCPT